MAALIRIVAHIEPETDKAIEQIVAKSPHRASKSAVIADLLSKAVARPPKTAKAGE